MLLCPGAPAPPPKFDQCCVRVNGTGDLPDLIHMSLLREFPIPVCPNQSEGGVKCRIGNGVVCSPLGGTYDRACFRIDRGALSNGRFGAASILDLRWGSATPGMSGPKGLFRATQIWASSYGYRTQSVSESIKARSKTADARRRTIAICVGRAARWFFGPGRNAL